jgi:hypothetical protein
MHSDFDSLREKTGIDKLDDRQRKKLFKDFVEHGGEIVDEEALKKEKRAKDQPKGAATKGVVQDRMREEPRKTPPKKIIQAAAARPAPPQTLPSRKVKFKTVDRLKLLMKGFLLGVFTLGGNKFSERFIRFFRGEGKNHFMNLYLLTNSFLKGSYSIKKEVLKLSTGENSTFYEFLYRMSILYEEDEYTSISKVIANKNVPSGPHIDIFKQFFKKLYIVGQFSDLCKFYVGKALDIQLQEKKLDSNLVAQTSSKLRTAVNAILFDSLRKFHIMLCKMAGVYYPLYSQKLDDYLCITEKDRIGYITRVERKKRIEELKKMKEYLKDKQTQVHEREPVEIKTPRHVERGMPLLDEAQKRFEQRLASKEDKNNFDLVSQKDKMYRTAILIEEFDREYSFILTTGKITFNIDYREQQKIDIKEDLNRAYPLMSEARHDVNDYLEIMGELGKTEDNLRLTPHQKSTMLDSSQKKRSVCSRTARRKAAEVMKSIETILSVVINDFNGPRRLIQNPEERLTFDENIEAVKRLHGKKIIEAVVEAFLFASAFCFLLNYGEISGSGIMIEEGANQKENPAPTV